MLLLVDCSLSMTQADPHSGVTLATATSHVVNEFLAGASAAATGATAVDIGVLGYGAQVASLLGQEPPGSLVPLDKLRSALESATGAIVAPRSFGPTPMVAALTQAEIVVRSWVKANPGAAAPTVVNITDGSSTDGDPRFLGEALRSVTTAAGALELCTVHLAIGTEATWFPSVKAGLADDQQVLVELASALSPSMRQRAERSGYRPGPGSHACVVGANAETLNTFLGIVSPGPLRTLPDNDQPILRPLWRTRDQPNQR